MKIYLLIQPSDYTRANVEVFLSEKEALEEKEQAKSCGYDVGYWTIKEVEV